MRCPGARANSLLVAGLGGLDWGDDPELAGLVFVIPEGVEVDRPGWDSAVAIPTDIRFKVEEEAAITVVNRDAVAQRAGLFLVGPGQTYVQRFPNPGTDPIACTVNADESIVVTVEG